MRRWPLTCKHDASIFACRQAVKSNGSVASGSRQVAGEGDILIASVCFSEFCRRQKEGRYVLSWCGTQRKDQEQIPDRSADRI